MINHLGIIADGNRRWARSKNLPTIEGHRKGLQVIEMLVGECAKANIPFVSFYVFSTENWSRSEDEVSYLMKLFASKIIPMAHKMKDNNIRMLILGSQKNVDQKLLNYIEEAQSITANCTGTTACFCFNYGGEQEIADAATLAQQEDGEITPETIAKHLYYPEIPPCDMIVRTSGEQRISGFMLWRAAYSEFLFLDKYFPEMEPSDVENILKEYENRNRRFGK